ncbi:MAG TPA: VWA domain-containing protein [Myxococcota bacterium]|nr:VWA domain-containing protein [Myxococcota bacterium]
MQIKTNQPRPLPVIVLTDVSGSMTELGKLATLNNSLREMVSGLAAETDIRGEIRIAVVTFGNGEAKVLHPPTPASDLNVAPLVAAGNTPMGQAFARTRELLSNHDLVPVNAFAPTLVLVSDGKPTDEWKSPLSELLSSDRGAKAQRFALAIGLDADRHVLGEFAGSAERLVEAADAGQIARFFRWVTMSVALRSRAVNPNAPALPLAITDDT